MSPTASSSRAILGLQLIVYFAESSTKRTTPEAGRRSNGTTRCTWQPSFQKRLRPSTFCKKSLGRAFHALSLVAFLLLLCGCCMLLTHYLTGIALSFPSVVILLGPILFWLALGSLAIALKLEYVRQWRFLLRAAALIVSVGVAIGLNLLLIVAVRFPVNFAALVYGNTAYP